MSHQLTLLVVLLALAPASAGAPGCLADEPGKKTAAAASGSSATNPGAGAALRGQVQRWRERLMQREIVQMVRSIAGGSQMGPGDGWFRPGQSRYGWKWLADRFDENDDGQISEDEAVGESLLFERLDRDHDGAIRAEDFDWSERSAFLRQSGQASSWFARVDSSSNGRVSREEWESFFNRVAGKKGFMTPEDLQGVLFPASPPPPKDSPQRRDSPRGPSKFVLMKGLLMGELGSLFEGPAIDEEAPDFSLKTHQGETVVRLSDFRGEKPVVLIFGSFT